MSGTSLDGLDIAYCVFKNDNDTWSFEIEKSGTVPYDDYWLNTFKTITRLSGLELSKKDLEYGTWLGKVTHHFIQQHHLQPDFIASHGHTVFHQPQIGLTLQIGNGMCLMKEVNLPVVNNFRLLDVILGGQGAPLVPIGDKLLFRDYDFCLNLGGIANVSFDLNGEYIAYDICPVNMALNYLAGKKGLHYDPQGSLARQGTVVPDLLRQLNSLQYYKDSFPKSLGYEWVKDNVLDLLDQSPEGINDLLATCSEHIASRISEDILKIATTSGNAHQKLLITGGGAYNDFLIQLINNKCANKLEIVVPDKNIIEFKEALIFAFLGVLRFTGENNCLRSVTGASSDNCGGVIFDNL